MADPTQGLPAYTPRTVDPNLRMMLGNMAGPPVVGQVAPAAFGGVGGVVAAPNVQRSPWLPDSAMTPADAAYYRSAAQPLTIPPSLAAGPGALAAAQGIAPNGFPVAQPGQGGTVAGLWQQALASNGAQAGIAQPQPVAPRMMGTADPLAGYPGFTNGAGAPAGFSPAVNAVQPVAPAAAPGPAFSPSPERLARAGVGATGGQAGTDPYAGTPGGVGGSVPPLPPLPGYVGAGGADAGSVAPLPAYSGGGAGGGGVGGGLTNPSAAIATGLAQQLSYQRQALGNIMSAASQGDSRNYSFRLGHLVGAMGNNNFGQVQGQGADALNQATASEADAGMMSAANIYATQGRAADVAQTIEGERRAKELVLQPAGQTMVPNPANPLFPLTQTTYATTQRGPGGMVTTTPAGPQADRVQAAKKIVGQEYTDKQGNRGTYNADGTFTPVK